MFKFKKEKTEGLEKAEQLDLITELEMLKLKKERAEKKYQKCLAKKNKKKK